MYQQYSENPPFSQHFGYKINISGTIEKITYISVTNQTIISFYGRFCDALFKVFFCD